MSTLINNPALSELMEHFYTLSGIKIALFDENYNEIMAYPASNTIRFCSYMRQYKDFNDKCIVCDRISFEKCRKTGKLSVHTCHAGLIEATVPIINNGRIIGYAMFGQITDIKGKDLFRAKTLNICQEYVAPNDELIQRIKTIKYRTQKQILAASKILDALASYILLKDMITPPKQKLLEKIEAFIDEHISERITIKCLCDEFYISKTQLYEKVGKDLKGGIASFIKDKRLTLAKKLLTETDMSINDISATVGFFDYNYFIRAFREQYGISPKQYRKSQIDSMQN